MTHIFIIIIFRVKEFAMYLGYNIRDRRACGLRLFNKNRLIVEIDGLQWSKWPLGVLACVDIPASLMQPSMSKQRFADEREFKYVQFSAKNRRKISIEHKFFQNSSKNLS